MTALMLAAAAPARAAPADAPAGALAALDDVRQQCIAAAHDAQQREVAVATLQHRIDLLGADEAGRQRDLDDSRSEQAHLLAALAFLARNLANPFVAASEPPLDRMRGELLVKAVVPELRAEARALADEIEQTAALRKEIAARQHDLAGIRQALSEDRNQLVQVVARRAALLHQMLPEDAADAGTAKLAAGAKDIGDLIRLAAAAAEQRDRVLFAHARAAPRMTKHAPASDSADPTRPRQLRAFDPPQSALAMPVSGTISQRFGAFDAAGAPSQGLALAAPPGGEVVVPFDGRVVYAGPFRNLGLVLIIQHDSLYHSLVAGLGRVDASIGQWVLAGEPVGAMPPSAGPLYFELRRDGRPVDPQPWLAARHDGRDEPSEEQGVRQ